MEVPQDSVIMEITVEEFVTADSVKAQFEVTYTVNDNGSDPKTEVLTNAKTLLDGEWYITDMNRRRGSDGHENVIFVLSVRVPDEKLNGLNTRLTQVNRPGLQFRHQGNDYTPRHAQQEAVAKTLREKVYERANDELVLLNTVIDDGDPWRIGQIDFVGTKAGFTRNLENTKYTAAFADAHEVSRDVTQKFTLSATVSLNRKIYDKL